MIRTLTLKELNRTTLQRQLLLERHTLPIPDAIEHLVGLQSQIPNPPYIGLWTRLQTFEKSHLTDLIEAIAVVRAPLMRSTLHLITVEMHQQIQATIQPALAKGFRSFFSKDRKILDADAVVTAAKPFLEDEPRSMGALRDFLAPQFPDATPEGLAYCVRAYLSLLQVPPAGTWGAGTRASYVPADLWLQNSSEPDLKALFIAYLRAFGPASIMDFQAFVGITSLKKTIQAWDEEFTIYQHTNGRDLYDLPDLEIISEDTSVPPIIFLPEYDNAIISYKDRDRILPDEHHKKVFLSAGRVIGTVLIDGFVGATWKSERDKDTASLRISLFSDVAPEMKTSIIEEGERLIRFIEDDATSHKVICEM